ncbi:MAG: pyridoxal 5'-phosphate synthase glutaminase subunit PdxT, partial [Vulcanimicrobiota bacterium]
MKIGVLALQGAFLEHIKVLDYLEIDAEEIRKKEQMSQVDGLIIPGGESTTIGKLLKKYGIWDPLKKRIEEGMPVFGTCAGMIVLGRDIVSGTPEQPSLGVLNITTERNAFGRQVFSFETRLDISILGEDPYPAVFIRAPIVKTMGEDVYDLAEYNEKVVAVREGNILATAFHPELTKDVRFHLYFIQMISEFLGEDITPAVEEPARLQEEKPSKEEEKTEEIQEKIEAEPEEVQGNTELVESEEETEKAEKENVSEAEEETHEVEIKEELDPEKAEEIEETGEVEETDNVDEEKEKSSVDDHKNEELPEDSSESGEVEADTEKEEKEKEEKEKEEKEKEE